MSDIDIGGACAWAECVIHDAPLGLVSETQSNAASALLFLAAKYRHTEAGAPACVDAPYTVLATTAYEKMRAELEEATLARGRLRLWLEFIHLNCTAPDAKEFAGEALIGNHVPEGFE